MNVIGLDLGTTTLSAVVMNAETGLVMETINIPNTATLPSANAWESLQDADGIAALALQMIDQLKSRYAVAAIGIDCQMHGILYVNERGHAVSPLYSWQDQRGELPLEDGTYASVLSARTGCAMATGYGLTTHFWHTVNGSLPKDAACLCTIGDYVGMQLTQRTVPLMHASSAASLGLFRDGWDMQAIRQAGMNPVYLPEVTDAYAVIGMDADDIPVCCAIGDNQASFIGSVREMEGTVLVNMGTGGQVSMMASVAQGTHDVEVRPLGEGKSILAASVLCGGKAYAMLEHFLRSCAQLAGYDGEALYAQMNEAGLRMLESDNLPSVDTRFRGTRGQPGLRGAIGGIGADNFDAAHLIGGTLMGMAQEMHGMYEQMLELGAQPARSMIGSGNAIRRNPALRRAFEKVFRMPMRMPAHQEEAACGAALAAMAAAGIKDTLAQAQALIRCQ